PAQRRPGGARARGPSTIGYPTEERAHERAALAPHRHDPVDDWAAGDGGRAPLLEGLHPRDAQSRRREAAMLVALHCPDVDPAEFMRDEYGVGAPERRRRDGPLSEAEIAFLKSHSKASD